MSSWWARPELHDREQWQAEVDRVARARVQALDVKEFSHGIPAYRARLNRQQRAALEKRTEGVKG